MKSFLMDLKNILILESFFWLIEAIILIVSILLIILCGDIVLLILIIIAIFIASQFYLYYLFKKKMIKKVYNPNFNKNKNIIIYMLLRVIVFLLFAGILASMVMVLMQNPFKIFTMDDEILQYKVLSYIFDFLLIILSNYLLFDLRKPLKNILASSFIMLMQYIIIFLVKGLSFSINFVIGFFYGLKVGEISIFGYILILILMFILIIFTLSIINTMSIQIIKYFNKDNIIEKKVVKTFEKNKVDY